MKFVPIAGYHGNQMFQQREKIYKYYIPKIFSQIKINVTERISVLALRKILLFMAIAQAVWLLFVMGKLKICLYAMSVQVF